MPSISIQCNGGHSTLEDETTVLSPNVGHKTPNVAAPYPKRTEILTFLALFVWWTLIYLIPLSVTVTKDHEIIMNNEQHRGLPTLQYNGYTVYFYGVKRPWGDLMAFTKGNFDCLGHMISIVSVPQSGWSSVRIPVGGEIFHANQSSPKAQPASVQTGTQSFTGTKVATVWCWPPTSFQWWGVNGLEFYLHLPSVRVQLCHSVTFTFSQNCYIV